MIAIVDGAVIAGRYRVVREIGRGGMGVVYEVEHVHTGEHLALKVLIGATRFDPSSIARFKREARAPAQIRSDHVVRVSDADMAPELDGAPFLVMELLDGCDLEAIVRNDGPLATERLLEVLRPCADALDAAHHIGIVHRDLKPENIFVHRRVDGTTITKILDFGISKFLIENEGGVEGATGSGLILGTPLYMSPEQARGENEKITAASDVWSLGLVAMRFMTGELYWQARSIADLITQILVLPMKAPSERWPENPRMSPALDTWFARSCNRDAAARFASIKDQVKELAAALQPRPSMPSPLASTVSFALDKTEIAPSSTPTTKPKTPRRKLPKRGLIALVAAAAIASMLVFGLKRWRSSVPQPTSSAEPSSQPRTFRDMVHSQSSNLEATQRYAEAIHAHEDANAGKEKVALDDAIALEDNFPAAQVQRAYYGSARATDYVASDRRAFRRALELRGGMTTNEAAFVDGITPAFGDPPEWRLAISKLEQLAALSRVDARVFEAIGAYSVKSGNTRHAEDAFRQTLAIDPRAGMASLILAQLVASHGEFDNAAKILTTCIDQSPTALGCRLQRASLLAAMGQCRESEGAARDAGVTDPRDPTAFYLRAAAAAAQGAPRDVVAKLLETRRSLSEPASREQLAASDDYELAARDGDFLAATVALEKWQLLLGPDSPTSQIAAINRARYLWEAGEAKQSGAVAADFNRRAGSRLMPERLGRDETGHLLQYAFAGGAISRDEFRKQRAEWLGQWQSRRASSEPHGEEADLFWIHAYATAGEPSAADVADAFENDDGTARAVFVTYGPRPAAYVSFDTAYGGLLLAAHRPEEAKARLAIAANACLIVPEVQATFLLGKLSAAQNDRERACAAFADVERKWGHAKPRSVTADSARAEAHKLACTF